MRELKKRRNIRPINEGSFIICMHACQLQIIVFTGGATPITPNEFSCSTVCRGEAGYIVQ